MLYETLIEYVSFESGNAIERHSTPNYSGRGHYRGFELRVDIHIFGCYTLKMSAIGVLS
jgi:hypothetical protein